METNATLRNVYLMESDGLHKIGCSARVDARLTEVAPCGRVVHCFPSLDAYAIEHALQLRFAHCRVEGMGREWFRLTGDEVEMFRRITRADRLDDLPPELRVAISERELGTSLSPLAASLIRIRKAAGMTQYDLADVTGIKRAMIGEIERGRRTPSLAFALKIVDALDCTLDDLMGRDPSKYARRG